MTISASRGSSTSTSLRLCSRAPEMTIRSEAATRPHHRETNRCSPSQRSHYVLLCDENCERHRSKGSWGEKSAEFALTPSMEGKSRRQALAALAAEQYGVVSYQQVMGLGYSSGAIEAAVDAGFLHRVHRAVFAVGHLSLSPHCQCLAAVMARGERALLSYRSAAWLWGFVPSLGVPIEVSVPWRGH